MLYEFLKKETDALSFELNEKKKALAKLETDRQEAKIFIRMLNESTDRKYAGFTPYEVTKDEDNKIEEVKQNLKRIDNEIEILKNEIPKLENRVEEYEKMTRYSGLLENINKEE